MIETKAPNKPDDTYQPSMFLAGSINMGQAVKWQEEVVARLVGEAVTIYNPRRDDWDHTWEQTIENEKFREQVEWELNRLDEADVILFYFDPDGQSPITLLELGLHLMNNIIVCCPDGYFRKGNVDVVCAKYGIRQVSTLDELIDAAIDEIHKITKLYYWMD